MKAALTGRMIALFIVLALGAVIAARLGAWQLDRASIRGAEEAQQIESERLEADPVPLSDVLRVGQAMTTDEKIVKVEVAGVWGEQLLVPDREIDGEAAYLVLSELRLSDGPDEGAMIPVLRGWIPQAEVDDAGGAAGVPAAQGTQTVIGYLHEDEAAASGEYGPGEVGAISIGQLLNLWGGPIFSSYIVAAEPVGGGVDVVPAPSFSEGAGMNIRNLLYAGEWFIFGGFALFLWWRMVRDEAQKMAEEELLNEAEDAAQPAAPETGESHAADV